MDKQKLQNAESLVKSLAPLVKKIEDAINTRLPELEMREAYKFLREYKARVMISTEDFNSLYSLFNDLSDSLRRPHELPLAIERCVTRIRLLPIAVRASLEQIVDKIGQQAPRDFAQPYSDFYAWVRLVFSDQKYYSVHLLQPRDESILDVTVSQREVAFESTPHIMQTIRDALALVPEKLVISQTKDVVSLTQELEILIGTRPLTTD